MICPNALHVNKCGVKWFRGDDALVSDEVRVTAPLYPQPDPAVDVPHIPYACGC